MFCGNNIKFMCTESDISQVNKNILMIPFQPLDGGTPLVEQNL